MNKYKSEAYEVVHRDAAAMFKIGAITEARMREYDEMCLVQESKPVYEAEKPVVLEHVTA